MLEVRKGLPGAAASSPEEAPVRAFAVCHVLGSLTEGHIKNLCLPSRQSTDKWSERRGVIGCQAFPHQPTRPWKDADRGFSSDVQSLLLWLLGFSPGLPFPVAAARTDVLRTGSHGSAAHRLLPAAGTCV